MSSEIGYFANLDRAKEDSSEAHSLHLKIATQLEHLLSDCNLAEDGFLLKHMQKNKLGYVSLKLLTSFKKIKVLTRDWRVTLAGARCSKLLEVNEEGTKVRRREPLPKWLLCSPTNKLLLAWNLFEKQRGEGRAAQGLEKPRVQERVSKVFSIYGNVTSIRILQPGKELPKELQCYAKRHSELGHRLCAVVKFDCLQAARRAHRALKAEEHKTNGKGMCVAPLGFPGTRHFTEEEPPEEEPPEESDEDTPEEAEPSQKKSEHKPFEDSPLEKSPFPLKGSKKAPRRFWPQKPLRDPLGHVFKKFSTGCQGWPFPEFKSRFSRRNGCSGDDGQESSRCPWVLRRKVTPGAAHPEARLTMPRRVLRLPCGPDGTKGFHGSGGRGKPLQQQ
ncbi:la-related protein 6b [Centroberyx gerrardi]